MSEILPTGAAGVPPVEADDDVFGKAGPLPTSWDEARRHPRFHYRSRVQATIYPLAKSGDPTPQRCELMTRDLSRGGVNLVHSQQLFPGQRIEVVLHDGSPRSVEVMWCRRLANRCYSAGCRFAKAEEASPTPDADSEAGAGTAEA